MAAESYRRGIKSCGLLVRPQPVINDKSYMGSVVGFINDVVPQAYSGTQKQEEKETIQWVKFEYADINDVTLGEGQHNGNTPPLLLILGYANGVQIWCVSANGEAQEVLSWRQGPVRALNVLSTPETASNSRDAFASKRPLVALCDSSSAGQQFCSVSFVSLKTVDQVHSIKFKQPIGELHCNKRVVAVTFQEKISVYDACTLKELFTVTGCYPVTGPVVNPIALHSRWLAYADRKLIQVHQTKGGMAGEGIQSYTATVIHAAKTLTKGLTMFGETVASSLTGHKPVSPSTTVKKELKYTDSFHPGIVTILDVQSISGQINTDEDIESEGIVAHFQAHMGEPIAAMKFDPSGCLLFTACCLGHDFHIFLVLPHPGGTSFGTVHHLYTLHRGDTTAKVQDVAFSLDSRWVAVSTLRGTTHIFPITPYGGSVSVRTHTSPRVVNRLSRFHKSAGLEEIQQPPSSTGRNSPVLSASPSSTSSLSTRFDYPSAGTARVATRCIPFPTVIHPHAQIKQPASFAVSGISNTGLPRSPPVRGRRMSGPVTNGESFSIAAAFAPPRAWLVGSPSMTRDKKEKRPVDSLFIINNQGILTEYILDPHPPTGANKVGDDSVIELDVTGHAQWNLLRPISSPEIKPPLTSTNPLMIAQQLAHNQTGHPHWSRVFVSDMNGDSIGDGNGGDHNEDLEENWLAQVEIITHVGPHRRLWMGPQFSFKTLQHSSNTMVLSSNSSALISQTPDAHSSGLSDIYTEDMDLQNVGSLNFPSSHHFHCESSNAPLLIEATSGSFEAPPSLLEVCGSWPDAPANPSQVSAHNKENLQDQLMERIADAMSESPYRDREKIERLSARTPSGGDIHFEEVSSRCNSDISLYHSPSQSTEHLLVLSSNQQDST